MDAIADMQKREYENVDNVVLQTALIFMRLKLDDGWKNNEYYYDRRFRVVYDLAQRIEFTVYNFLINLRVADDNIKTLMTTNSLISFYEMRNAMRTLMNRGT